MLLEQVVGKVLRALVWVGSYERLEGLTLFVARINILNVIKAVERGAHFLARTRVPVH